MNFTVNYKEKAVVETAFSVELNPADYLEYNTEDDVFAAIDAEIGVVNYDDSSSVKIEECDLQIPKEFWDKWKELKSKTNDNC